MRVFLFLLPLLFFVIYDADAHFTGKGHLHTLSEIKQVFENRDCHATNSCDLRRFALITTDHEVWFSDDPNHPTYGKGTIIEYETASVGTLEKYAVVQFKKGCVYYIPKNGPRDMRNSVQDLVPSFGAEVPFCFHDWVIDSQDTDPAYNSDPELGRFYLLRWNKAGSYEQRTQKFYGREKPNRPVVYLADYPAGAFVTATGVRNVALAFRTCIYRAADVPLSTERTNVDFAKPIHCLQWDNIYIYDFAAQAFHATWPDLSPLQAPEKRLPDFSPALLAILLLALLAAIPVLARSWLRRRMLTP